MDLREEILRRRKDARFIIGGLGGLLVVCGIVYYLLQRGHGLPAELATNRLLIFVLWYVNLILILTLRADQARSRGDRAEARRIDALLREIRSGNAPAGRSGVDR